MKSKLVLLTLPCILAVLLTGSALVSSTTSSVQSAPQSTSQAASNGVEYGSFQSASLGKELKYAVQLPPSYQRDSKRRFPVLYFLHGMFGSEKEFEARGVAAAITRLRSEGRIGEFIIAAPAGESSFYVNSKNGVRYEDAVVKDLVPHIEKNYRVAAGSRGRAIQGISMGGFGALMIAFKHPEMFSSVTAHSSALFTELPKPTGTSRRDRFISGLIGKIFGDPPDEAFYQSNNPIKLAEMNAAAIKKAGLKVYFDVGDQDRYGFQDSNRILDEQLTKAGIAHEFHVFPGNHGWEYMLSVIDHSYGFLWKQFETSNRVRAGR
jgi:S-formylglutathione hydrolase FrmB